MPNYERETAKRLFAAEYLDTTLEEKGGGEREPSYLITPMGEKINRVLITGVITEIDNKGSPEEPFYRGRVSDGPSGFDFYISGGRYQPSVQQFLGSTEVPNFVTCVGKTDLHTYEGQYYQSVRGEKISIVSEEERNRWILEAAESTLERIKMVEDAERMDKVTVDKLVSNDYDEHLVKNYMKAREHYDDVNIELYKDVVINSLKMIHPDHDAEEINFSDEKQDRTESTDEHIELQEELFNLLVEEEDQDGLKWEKAREIAKEELGIKQEKFKEIINKFKGEGKINEPVMGYIKTE